MRGAARLIKIGALFFAAVTFTAVPDSKSAYAQNRGVGNFGHPSSGSFNGRPGIAQNRGVGNFGHFGGSFLGVSRFGRRGFDRGRRDFGQNIVAVPSVVAPPYYDAPALGYDSLRCILHRHVETPNGWALEPVYVC
jgi:hypothetical protein